MKKIKYSELFYSFQGEGRYVGVPSVFLRTFGCNFECPGFGQPRNNLMPTEYMPHNKYVDATRVKSINDIPIFDVGCDSSASWSKKYKHLAKLDTPEDLAYKVSSLVPFSSVPGMKPHFVITGGEPLLGWQKLYPDLFMQDFFSNTFRDITFETNGTQVVNEDLIEYLNMPSDIIGIEEVTWSVSPKLSISGETKEDAIIPDALLSMNKVTRSYLYLKFVVRNEVCVHEAINVIRKYDKAGVKINAVYLMPEGATEDGLALTEKEVAKLCLKYGFWFSPRLHVHIFGNHWGT